MPLPLPSSDAGGARSGGSLPQPPPTAHPTDGPPVPPPTGPPSANAPSTTTCYRHPDRPTGRRCTRCGRPACGDCLVAASIGSHCLDCAKASRPDLRTRARFWSAGKSSLVATTIIAINVAVFVLLGLANDIGGMLSGSVTQAHVDFGLFDSWRTGVFEGRFRVGAPDEWYRLVTSGFLHFGIIHLGMNMFFLYILGNEVEPMLGRVKFGLLYAASLLGGSAGVMLFDSGAFTAGASGAVFGLLGAYAVGIWRHGINVFNTNIGSLLLINLFLTFTIRNISIGGHVGGLVAGAICGFVMLSPGYKGVPNWAKYATPVAVGVASVVVAYVATSS